MSTPTDTMTSFKLKSWDEKPYLEVPGEHKLTRASVVRQYSGDLEGEGMVEYLMIYSGDGSATFVGLERVVGRLGGRSGSFVLEHRGVAAENGVLTETSSVVPGSGTEELAGLRGDVKFVSGHAEEYPYPLAYTFG